MPIKKVFFAEDRPETIIQFKAILQQKNIAVESEETWDEACDYIEQSIKEIPPDIVVIDVNIPIIPKKLLEYANSQELRGARDLNQGQAFGLWLRENVPTIPYIYLTNMPSVFNPDASDYQALIKAFKAKNMKFDIRDFIIVKSIKPDDFYNKLDKFYDNWHLIEVATHQ